METLFLALGHCVLPKMPRPERRGHDSLQARSTEGCCQDQIGGCRLSNTSLLTSYTQHNNCKGGRDVNMAEQEGLGKRSPLGLSSNRPLLQSFLTIKFT